MALPMTNEQENPDDGCHTRPTSVKLDTDKSVGIRMIDKLTISLTPENPSCGTETDRTTFGL